MTPLTLTRHFERVRVPRPHSPRLLGTFATLCGLCSIACGTERLVGECSSNADCATGEVCNLLARQCIRDADEASVSELQFEGSFHCEVALDAKNGLLGRSDVVGRLDGELVYMNESAVCLIDDAGRLHINLSGRRILDRNDLRDPRLGLTVLVRASVAASEERVLVSEDPTVALYGGSDLASAYLASYDDRLTRMDYVAFSVEGSLEFEDTVELGARVDGSVDVTLAPMAHGEVGAPCAEFLDCDSNLGLLCTGLGCTDSCESQEDCDEAGAVCVDLYVGADPSYCLAPCQQDGDCNDPFVCTMYSAGQGVCGPDVLVGAADSPTLGSGCQVDDDCGNEFLRCESLADAPGICTEECDGECIGYVGLDVACIPLGDIGLCFQRCADAWECTSGLACVNTEFGGLCLPIEVTQAAAAE